MSTPFLLVENSLCAPKDNSKDRWNPENQSPRSTGAYSDLKSCFKRFFKEDYISNTTSTAISTVGNVATSAIGHADGNIQNSRYHTTVREVAHMSHKERQQGNLVKSTLQMVDSLNDKAKDPAVSPALQDEFGRSAVTVANNGIETLRKLQKSCSDS